MTIYFSESALCGIDATTLQELRNRAAEEVIRFNEYYARCGFSIAQDWPKPNRARMTPSELLGRVKALMSEGITLQDIANALSPKVGNEPEPDPIAVAVVRSITPADVQETRRQYVLAARGARQKVA